MSNLTKRVITGIFLIIFIYCMIFINRLFLLIGLLLLSNISIYELLNVLGNMKYRSRSYLTYVFNTIFLLISEFLDMNYIFPIFTIYIFIMFIIVVLNEEFEFEELLTNTFTSVYITFPYSYLLLIKDERWILYAFALPALTDTFAYFVGMFFGKNKLIERLSPKKTIEGAIGGLIGGLMFTFIFLLYFNIDHSPIIYVIAAILSVVSQIGDLFASYIKRKANVKDYGNILIGHGGIMDRFDSLLLVAPIVFILVNYLR